MQSLRIKWLHLAVLPSFFAAACSSSDRISGPPPEVHDGGGADATPAALVDAMPDSATSTSVTVSASIQGKAFDARGGAAHQFTFAGPSAGSLGLSLLLGEYENVCQAPRVALSPALFFTLRAPVGEALVRTYSIVNDTVLGGSGPAPQATVQAITMTNTDCGLNNVDQASGGTITVTKYENGFVEGSFDTTFAKGGPAHGTFRIAVCGPSSGTDDGTAKCLL